jgi:type IV secretory pathway VirB3-like protein
MSISFNWETKGTCETEISKFYISVLVNQEILGLEISVHDSVCVAISSALQNLISEALHFVWRQWSSHLPHVFLQVVLAILENQVQFILRINDLLQSASCSQKAIKITQQCWGASDP